MKSPFNILEKSIKEVLSRKNYFLLFLGITIFMFLLYIILPVITIPGNSFLFQISIFGLKDYSVLVPLSLLLSLMIVMQTYSHKKKKSLRKAGHGVVGGSSGAVAGIFGTASCSSCIAALFGFLGTGTILFLVNYQWYIVGISTILVLMSIYLTSLNIEENCKVC